MLKTSITTWFFSVIFLDQDFIGSVVIQSEIDEDEDDDDDNEADTNFSDSGTIFGITTAVNISAEAPPGCLQQLRKFLLDKIQKHPTAQSIAQILNDEQKSVALLINERFVNIPPQIAIPMLENLQKEVQRAAIKREGFRFDYYIMIVKLYQKDGKNKSKEPETEEIYSNGEEEVICEQSKIQFSYSVQNETDSALTGNWRESDTTLTPYRRILLLEANQLDSVIQSIQQLIE